MLYDVMLEQTISLVNLPGQSLNERQIITHPLSLQLFGLGLAPWNSGNPL